MKIRDRGASTILNAIVKGVPGPKENPRKSHEKGSKHERETKHRALNCSFWMLTDVNVGSLCLCLAMQYCAKASRKSMVIEPENKTCSTTQAVAQPVNIPATAAAENFQNMKGFEMLKYNFHCHFYCPRYQQAQLRDPNAGPYVRENNWHQQGAHS